jgi:hypothetical protein
VEKWLLRVVSNDGEVASVERHDTVEIGTIERSQSKLTVEQFLEQFPVGRTIVCEGSYDLNELEASHGL